eukprot:CAMPEP_0198602154 /NCGR_PEP_ID=MMETSP1462-20131121/150374_1 /TAXON_ID=1333877 /ORGANISM="Brandtodinium nutriculum, Strain RCC3387" /LENGTH=55 /DNA_ID=CAMNT_0044333899 /DNA_START=141 /DNA_END=305 /DNA_ORIENTATION=+
MHFRAQLAAVDCLADVLIPVHSVPPRFGGPVRGEERRGGHVLRQHAVQAFAAARR